MKRALLFCVILAVTGGIALAQDEYGDDFGSERGGMYFQAGAGIMYIHDIGYDGSVYNLRGGGHADVLFSMGMVDVGMEIGLYAMEADYNYYDYGLFIDIMLDALVRINFSPSRDFALELRGGGWLYSILAYYEHAWFGINAGARMVISFFYIGADYIYMLDPYPLGDKFAVEVGVKFSF